MAEPSDIQSKPDLGIKLDESVVCERCGKIGAFQFTGRALCEECYSGCGSCCPEFGPDDLWQSDDSEV